MCSSGAMSGGKASELALQSRKAPKQLCWPSNLNGRVRSDCCQAKGLTYFFAHFRTCSPGSARFRSAMPSSVTRVKWTDSLRRPVNPLSSAIPASATC